MRLDDLETPAMIIDVEVMEDNLRRMADYSGRHGIALRPHIKTHKMPRLARRQLELGAQGITVAKLGEAEVMSEAGLEDLMLAYPPFGEAKARRLRAVLERARVSVSLDSEEAVATAGRAADGARIPVFVEIDLGARRCGVPPGPEAVRLARLIEATPGLDFEGLMFYPGHVHPDFDGNNDTLNNLVDELQRLLELFAAEKFPVPRISGGSTPSAPYCHLIPGLDEMRPGTYIFNDRNTLEWKTCTEEQCAASLLVTVISNAVPGRVIVDGGSKTFSSDPLGPGTRKGHGLVRGYPEMILFFMNEEHGFMELPPGVRLKVGQRLRVIPNHICGAVNLHDVVFPYRGQEVLGEWTIEARGRIR